MISDIKCYFCDRMLEYHHPTNASYNCHGHCDMGIAYHFESTKPDAKLEALTFIFGHRPAVLAETPWTYHHLSLSFRDKKTSVYYFGTNKTLNREDHLLFTLDHLIEGVTAQNAQQTLDRLLSLNVFS